MTDARQFHDDEGTFSEWKDARTFCSIRIEASGLPCHHPVEYRVWESNDGAYVDHQYRCQGGGHVWWIEGPDA